ncbi:MAG: RNA 2'-phosphotransferase [Bacteroidia bacterium]|nr:RNA 2'-phosphotransferase [Bacteroidia bacterium]
MSLSTKKENRISKFLSLVLRHKPETIGIELDASGWVNVDTLLVQMKANGMPVEKPELEQVVANNAKQRFSFNTDQTKIRANQGHSISVELGLPPTEPPEILYHGSAAKNFDSIVSSGLLKGSRQHVHLSADIETAAQVGQRHGKPIVFQVDAGAMHKTGILFFKSDNGVWLTEYVPKQYLSTLND